MDGMHQKGMAVKKMKACLVAPTPPPAGGIAGWTRRMLETTLKNGWEVVVVDTKLTGNRTVFGAESKKTLLDEARRSCRIWYALRRTLKNPEIKVVHTCFPATSTAMLREIGVGCITKMCGRKLITHFRCTVPNMVKTRCGRLLFKIVTWLSDDVFLLNTPSVDFLRQYSPKKKCKLIPNFIESVAIPQERQYSAEIKRAVYIGGVIPEKGCDHILVVAQQMPEIQFRLIGKIGIDVDKVPANVMLAGEVDKARVQDELKQADVFLFLGRFLGEGFSNALAEAMAYSLPCIVTDWAANADMIENKGGVVVGADTVQDTMRALQIINSPKIRQEMGRWNREKVLRYYSDVAVTAQYVDAYEKLLVR